MLNKINMKKETIKKRLARIAPNKATVAYKLINNWLNVEGNMVIRPCCTSGRGRFTTNLDYTEQLKSLLTSLRVRYISGNDAPRGGKSGNYIYIILNKRDANKILIDAFLSGKSVIPKNNKLCWMIK